ncbi:MAG: hypothetical protein ACR2L1_06015 [Pyrinomonadaceae bacterium]
MKFVFSVIFFFISSIAVSAQTAVQPTPSRQRVVSSQTQMPQPTPVQIFSPTPAAPRVVVITENIPLPAPTPAPKPVITPSPTPFSNAAEIKKILNIAPPKTDYGNLTLGELRNKISEAKRLMQMRPVPTAMTDSFMITDVVRLAFYDKKTDRIDFVVLTKAVFLSKDSEIITTTSNGRAVRVHILRANGVNTAVSIIDDDNTAHTPLIVQYPIEKNGVFLEMAYYISTHPGVVTPEVVSAGNLYVRNTINIARAKLKQKGIYISPQIADAAERLSTVEHVDHQRFWTENQPQLYKEIFALYALNEGDTYRYSVSSAGAGGMVQMIPWTYNMIRTRFYNVGLIPDFVTGMRNHQNAAQAMLLYMQATWNDLISNPTIYAALSDGTASQAEMLAAGYNSNPAKLAGYINRGGSNWRTLIPRETKIYLQIYTSLENAVPMTPRAN